MTTKSSRGEFKLCGSVDSNDYLSVQILKNKRVLAWMLVGIAVAEAYAGE